MGLAPLAPTMGSHGGLAMATHSVNVPVVQDLLQHLQVQHRLLPHRALLAYGVKAGGHRLTGLRSLHTQHVARTTRTTTRTRTPECAVFPTCVLGRVGLPTSRTRSPTIGSR